MTTALVDVAEDAPVELVVGKPPLDLVGLLVTSLIVFGPLAGVGIGAVLLFRSEVSVTNIVIAIVLYLVSGHGLSAGYHRMCTHRGFQATRATKIVLVLAGSLTFEGGVLSWVANHRLHHAYTDIEGDPHSPQLGGGSGLGQLRGALHAHIGWLFSPPKVDYRRWIPDLYTDADLVLLDRLFPLLCLVSLGIPALLGFAFTGTARGALGGFIWGGLVRVCLLQQATFAVNSACHLWGKQPFTTRRSDQARNLGFLSLFAMGDNWHNLHHSLPRLVRHGVGRHQWDSTARLIWVLEKFSLVSDVQWPDPARLDERRRRPEMGPSSADASQPG